MQRVARQNRKLDRPSHGQPGRGGKSLGASLAPAVLTATTVIVTLAALGSRVVVTDPVWFAAGLVAAVVSGTALGTMLCSLFLLTRYGPQLSGALLYPVFLLAGLLIPTDFFPAAVRWLGWLVSLRWAQQFLVSAAGGHPDFTALAMVGLLTAGYAVAGIVAFRRIDLLARRRGAFVKQVFERSHQGSVAASQSRDPHTGSRLGRS